MLVPPCACAARITGDVAAVATACACARRSQPSEPSGAAFSFYNSGNAMPRGAYHRLGCGTHCYIHCCCPPPSIALRGRVVRATATATAAVSPAGGLQLLVRRCVFFVFSASALLPFVAFPMSSVVRSVSPPLVCPPAPLSPFGPSNIQLRSPAQQAATTSQSTSSLRGGMGRKRRPCPVCLCFGNAVPPAGRTGLFLCAEAGHPGCGGNGMHEETDSQLPEYVAGRSHRQQQQNRAQRRPDPKRKKRKKKKLSACHGEDSVVGLLLAAGGCARAPAAALRAASSAIASASTRAGVTGFCQCSHFMN
jgi:hypothetical protein